MTKAMAKKAKGAAEKAPKRAAKAPERTEKPPKRAAKAPKRVENAISAVEDVIRAAGWSAHREDVETGVAFGILVDGGEAISHAHAEVIAEAERFVLVFMFRKKAPKKRRAEVAELLTRANYGMVTGNFEMDFESGEVRYRYGIDFNGVELAPLLVRNAILSSLDGIETYDQALSDVMAGKASPQEAIASAEAAMMVD